MTRRHASLAFMGGMWVFPGGALSAADRSAAAQQVVLDADRCAFALRDISGQPLSRSVCLALAIAACRETFEEAGLLLARRMDGAACTPEQLLRLQAERAALATDPAAFIAWLEREALRLDASQLIYWAHWITPSSGARRFDTRFFVARAPHSHELVADTVETTECLWMSPADLLAKAQANEMRIAQPTRYNLEDLRASIDRHRTLDALMSAEAQRVVQPIMPKMFTVDRRTTIVMPWDATYASLPGEAVPAGLQYEPALLALPSRIEMDH